MSKELRKKLNTKGTKMLMVTYNSAGWRLWDEVVAIMKMQEEAKSTMLMVKYNFAGYRKFYSLQQVI